MLLTTIFLLSGLQLPLQMLAWGCLPSSAGYTGSSGLSSRGLQLQQAKQAWGCLRLQHWPTHLSLFLLLLITTFSFQWPPAPVADTSVRLPLLTDQATQVLQNFLPVAYSNSRRSKRKAASARNTGPHISCFNSFYSYASISVPPKPLRPILSVRLLPLKIATPPWLSHSQLSTSFKVTIFSFNCNITACPTKCCCLTTCQVRT